MRYGSVCSGIEAASMAWHPLGLEPAFFSEIEPFPCAVLKHHYPDVPNYGDMTKFKEWPDATIDVLVGGTPCQSFSVAGLRAGLADPRGNLMLTFGAIADKYSPTWLVWENVPGVLSSNGGKDFGTFLGMLAELGYGFAYRVLDAQYVRTQSHPRAVPQRRRRVFVVGHLGDWRRAAAVLFERDSVSGNPAPSRKTREGTTGSSAIGIDEECNASHEHYGPLLRGGQGGTRQAVCMSTGQASAEIGTGTTLNCNHEAPIACYSMITANTGANGLGVSEEIAPTLDRAQPAAVACYPINTQIATRSEAMGEGTGLGIAGNGEPAYTLQAAHSHAVAYSIMPMNSGKDYKARETDISQPIMAGGPVGGNQGGDFVVQSAHSQAVAFEPGIAKREGNDSRFSVEVCPTLRKEAGDNQPAVAFAQNTRDEVREMDVVGALAADPGMKQTSYIRQSMQVRRLTPTECARLQGFPDDYLDITFRNKPACDGPKYKALGNSMAVNCMTWIGERIKYIEKKGD